MPVFASLSLAVASLCGGTVEPEVSQISGTVAPAAVVGTMSHKPIGESSGLVASRRQPGVLWTHNDGGHPAVLFAITKDGTLLRDFQVSARNTDWEDIAVDESGRIYLADIGNNSRTRREVQVYVVEEPKVDNDQPAAPLKPVRTYRLSYPNQSSVDAEAFFIHAGFGYLIAKQLDGGNARLFRFELSGEAAVQTLEPAGEVPLRLPVTGADLSADGKWLAVLTVGGPNLFRIDNSLADATEKVTSSRFRLDPLAEGIAFVPDGLLVTNEERAVLLFAWQDGGMPATRPAANDYRMHRNAPFKTVLKNPDRGVDTAGVDTET